MSTPTITPLAAWRELQQLLLEAIGHASTLAARLDPDTPDEQLVADLVRQLDGAKVAAMRAGQTARAAEGV